jgi:hypothetical protein
MDDRWAWPLLLFVAAITVGAYLLAWRSKRPALKNTGTALTLAIVAVGAFVMTFGALRLPSDFFQPGVPKSTTAIAEVLCCAVAIFLWIVFARMLKSQEKANSAARHDGVR